jgi:hypothetical protein
MHNNQPGKMSSQKQTQEKPIQATWIPAEMFLNNRSWAQMIADEEEEEEQERKMLEQEKLKNIIACRQFLYSIGEYELEDGEILE